MADPNKPITEFGSTPSAYRDLIDRARAGAPPVGGAPLPPIPDSPSGPADPVTRQPSFTPDQLSEAQRSGVIIPGVGSGYPVNQPAGQRQQVGQSGPSQTSQGPAAEPQFANPPRPPGEGLRPETKQGLEQLGSAMAAQKKAEDEAEKLNKEVEEFDSQFDYDEYGNRIHNLLQNKQRRIAIEARCEPIRLEDLIVHQEVRQRVPIFPGRYEPTFRSVSGDEDLWIKQKMSKERGSEAYIRDKYAFMTLTAGLLALNGKPFETHLDRDGFVDEEKFLAKQKAVLRFPMDMLADLSVNHLWFTQRVRKLLVFDEIKGF